MSDTLGIDIGTNTIKVVSISKEGEKLVVDAVGEAKTPRVEWARGDKNNKAIDEVAQAVKKLLWDLKMKRGKAVACLPEDAVVSRLIRLPPLKETEIRDALKFEAETFVPYPLDQVSIDYEIVETDQAGRTMVFAIAAKNDLIQTYIKLFKSVGVELIALESPAVAIKRSVSRAVTVPGGVMVIDMGEKFSDIVMLDKGKVYFTRSMSVGGESITRAISMNLGLDMASAEEYKKAYGMKPEELEGKIRKAMEPIFVSMTEERRKAITLFQDEYGKIDVLALSGGGANLPGLAEELTKILGLEVQRVQPFLKMETKNLQLPMDLNTEGCRFTQAVGLALRGLI